MKEVNINNDQQYNMTHREIRFIPFSEAQLLELMTTAVKKAMVQPAKKSEPKLLTKTEAMTRLACSISTIEKMLRDGRLKKIKIGRSTRITESSILGQIERSP